ncbi:MAG: phosphate ABC transporter ATP-binding protein PstB [Alicyclobacillaceae bacterium]|nr:phosphate ABC transporter ATP-binding protein PstB [Alicyclobacillaceae bacterium]
MAKSLTVTQLNAWFGRQQVLKDISMSIEKGQVTALIGPSGCGKSTLVRCFNRMHETNPSARIRGTIVLGEEDILALPPATVRRRIGMVFKEPNPFFHFSIYNNVAIGLKLSGLRSKRDVRERVEQSLRECALWDEVKDHLNEDVRQLSLGQQQRLCMARALAMEPHVLLMDEPASALDPVSTVRIEELIDQIKGRLTIVIVTHNLQQAARIADNTAFFLEGELVELGETSSVFTRPADARTEDYIAGRFG